MALLLHRLNFFIELIFSGSFILIYSLKSSGNLPDCIGPELAAQMIDWGAALIPLVLFVVVLINFLCSDSVEDFLRRYVFSLIVFVPLVLTRGDHDFAFWLSSAHLLSSVLALYDERTESKKVREEKSVEESDSLFGGLRLKPAQMVLLSFAGVIFMGTALLMIPFASKEGVEMSFVDALFTAASAACVTGLSTISLTENFSVFGQVVILGLIQIGGISIMTLYSSMTILLGKSLGMKDRVIMQDLLDVSSLEELFSMILDILKYTFFIEFWGGIILTVGFSLQGHEFSQALYLGIFHSISAFCNAGFSLFSTSLESYATNPLIHGTISALIILGGLGFIVLKELSHVVLWRKSLVRLGLHTKIVVLTSLLLLVGGFFLIFFGEFLNALDGYSLWEKIQISFFQSATLRSAGFNTIPLTNLHTYTIYAMTLFMFIGGSPGSCAGGIKTTSLAILVQSIKSTLKSERNVHLLDRRIPGPLVVRATAITFLSIIIVSSLFLLLIRMEPEQSFLTLFFEAVSAFGTVGLSLGVTSFLSVPGKLIITLLMYAGRIGPLTMILAIGQQSQGRGKFDYPAGRIMIG